MIPFWSLEKISIGPVNFYTWGFFLALAIITVFYLTRKKFKKNKKETDIYDNLFSFLLAGIILGSRIGYVIQFPSYYFSHLIEIFEVWDGGMIFWGGAIGAIIAGWLFFKSKKLNPKLFWKIADAAAVYLPLGIAIGRIGCFLINDHQGKETKLPWGIIWPDGTVRHPVALYLIIDALFLFIILKWLKKLIKTESGLFLWFLVLHSFSRFLWDFMRENKTIYSDPSYFNLTLAQWISLGIAGIALWRLKINPRQSSRQPD